MIFAHEGALEHQHAKLGITGRRTIVNGAQQNLAEGHGWTADDSLNRWPPNQSRPSEATKLGMSWISALILSGFALAFFIIGPHRTIASLRTVFIYLAALASAVWLTLLSKL